MPSNRRTVLLAASAALTATLALPATTQAQYSRSSAAIGERYHVEIQTGFWSPIPDFVVSSESLGIPGDEIDARDDLDIAKKRLLDWRVVLRPGRKHKLRISQTPLAYESEAILERTIVFNGIRYEAGLPVNADLEWYAWRFGYEYDFIYRDRGFLGVILEAKYTDVRVDLRSPLAEEFTRARGPIPAVGLIGRVYPLRAWAFTAELSGMTLPEFDERYSGDYVEFDASTTINFADNIGVQAGYRLIRVNYTAKLDHGELKPRGGYLAAVVRF